jgi:hypothetical protein
MSVAKTSRRSVCGVQSGRTDRADVGGRSLSGVRYGSPGQLDLHGPGRRVRRDQEAQGAGPAGEVEGRRQVGPQLSINGNRNVRSVGRDHDSVRAERRA